MLYYIKWSTRLHIRSIPMKKHKLISDFDNSNDKILKNISSKKPHPIGLVSLILIYLIATAIVIRVSRDPGIIMIFGIPTPFKIFTGVFNSLANMAIICLAVFYGKIGFFTSIAIFSLQIPVLFIKLFALHDYSTIPGFFMTIFTMLTICIIYLYNKQLEKYQGKIRQQALNDMLTGLPNRFACTELMNDRISKQARFTLVSIDLDNFKSINDTMGHDVGDSVLKEIANRWKDLANSRKSGTKDFVARLGGDEFSLVIRGYNSDKDIINSINMYKSTLEQKITIDDYDYFMNASFGYAQYPEDAENTAALFSYADAALHEIKRLNSSNSILHFSSSVASTEQFLEIERKVRTAIDSNSVFMHLQPQYDSSHKLRGFEALARIKDTDGRFINPATFIPVAEKTGLIDEIDNQILKKSAAFLADILKTQDSNIIISCNISVKHLMKNTFIEEIKEIIQSSGVPTSHFEIEITESIMIDSDDKALKCINDIRDMGIKVAIDDFGTGYSSLSYLNKFTANMLKIDKSFIDVMNTSDSSKKYVESIISIGHILNLKVISEGVETLEQLDTLKSIGCDYIQGFIWGRPMAPEDAKKLIPASSAETLI